MARRINAHTGCLKKIKKMWKAFENIQIQIKEYD